ncbi:MAG: thymidine phosphorylase, partial [Pseudothermotoga sp.]
MRMYDIIKKKRDGEELTTEEIRFVVHGYTRGEIPDYQMAAFLMAVYFRGMNERETYDLTIAMLESGERLDLSSLKGVKLDKHSSGGVGDKITFVVLPIAASFGVKIIKMSGRGLGHTGGTIDKLESIPGMKTSLTRDEFIRIVDEIGFAVASQTENLAPADKKIYALRDATATVENLSLIASSIVSKKLAAG